MVAALASVIGLVAMGAGAASAAPAQPAAAAAASARSAPAATKPLKPVVRQAIRHDKSKPLRSVKPVKTLPLKPKHGAIPLGNVPHGKLTGTSGLEAGRLVQKVLTKDVQRAATVSLNAMPAFEQNFEGVGNNNGVLPPDTNMAVGPNDVLQTVNFDFQVFDKSGNSLLGPETMGTLFQGLGGECDPSVDPAANGGDPVALYDEAANRFIVTQLAYPQLILGSGGFHECIAISQTGDPTGAWFRYDFLASNTSLNDYPKLGVWPDAYYMSNNNFLDGQVFTGVTVTAFDRAQMLAGQPASDVQFTIGSQFGSLLPSDTEGATLGFTPPSGAPNPYWMSCDAANGGPCSSDQMDEWDFHVDWTNPANSTFGNNGAPNATIPVATFNSNLCNFNRSCIPQPGTSVGLDALSDRLMYQAAYRNLGNGTQAVVFDQSVNVSTNGNQAGVRWYEFTNTGSGWGVGDQGTYAPDSDNRWMGSTNIDVNGNIAVGYSVSSSSTDPSIRVAGRLAGDPAGQLSQGEETMIAGGGAQTSGFNRWGDYSAMQVDPTDGCTFWYTTEYNATTSDSSWHTRIGSFKYPSCVVGPHGTVSGTVTDSATGNPIAGATVSAGSASTSTTSTGTYTLTLPVGTYTETIAAFGYATDTINGVNVTDNGNTTENAALSTVPSVTVSGNVTDGSGQGWGLHASILVTGRPGGPVWTDPSTGAYSVSLPEDATYALTVTTDLPGYQVVNDSVAVGTSDVTHNISVPVNANTCNAPGYSFFSSPVVNENFDDYSGAGGTTPPPGWTIQDNKGNGQVWDFNNPEGRGNLTGGSGFFAAANSDQFGPGASQDTSLISPTFSLAGESNPTLQFNNDYFGFPNQTGAVDVSTDGGTTWTNVWQHTTDSVRGPDLEVVSLAAYAGDTSVQVRFHFVSTFGWWWEVDNVLLGNRVCSPQTGGLVVGQTTDQNTGNGLNGVTVTESDASPAVHVTSGPTADPNIGNGYYWLFSSETGSHPFTAAKGGYGTANATVNITSGGSTRANFPLGAGRLSITPSSITTSQVLGTTTNTTMNVSDTGTAPVNVKLVQQGGTFQLLNAQGSKLRLVALGDDQQTGATPAFLGGHANDGAPLANAGPPQSAGTWSTITSYPTGVMDNSADFINGKEYSVGGLNTSFALLNNGYVYDPVANTWNAIANMPVAREKPGVVADNGKLVVTGGWNSAGTPIPETDVYDPNANSWTTVSPNPSPTTAPGVASVNGLVYLVAGCADSNCTASSNVEVYNPATDTWASAAPYPHGDSWLSCGGINGKVYCAGGVNGNTTYSDAFVLDPGANAWTPIANLPIDLWASASGAPDGLLVVSGGVTNGFSTVTNQGFAYDPVQNTWTSIPNAQFTVYRSGGSCGFYQIGGSSGGFSPQSSSEVLSGLAQCGTSNIPWMAENPTTFTLQPGQTVPVTVTLTATQANAVTQPGTYTAQIAFEQNTPYDVSPVDVTMNVTPPTGWGKITGTLFGENCSQTTKPLRGVIFANGKGKSGFQFTLPTGTNGSYAFWGPANGNPWQLTASAAGWIAVNSANINIKGGKTITENFTLRPVTC